MASELSKLMKQYGVSSATMAVPQTFKETAPTAPTAPLAPVKPADFTDTTPDYISYGLTKSQAGNIKAAPTALDKKEQVGADLKTIQDNWTAYQKDLASFNANSAANKQAMDVYNKYVKPDPKFTDKNTYDYQNNQYQLANQKYKSALDTYNTNKTAFDTSKGDVYNTYKTAYQDRIAQTPMYLQQQFTRTSDVNPYEGMYSPYGSIDNYNKTGTYWNDVIGDPTYTGAYTPYTPLYKQKGFADQASYEATLPEYLDNKNSQDSLSGGDTNDGLTKVPSTIVDTNGNDSLTGANGNGGLTNKNPNADKWWWIAGYNSPEAALATGKYNADGTLKSTGTTGGTTDNTGNTGNTSLTDLAIKNGVADTNNINLTQGTDVVDQNLYPTNTDKTVSNVSGVPTLTDLAVKNGVENYTYAPSSQQQLEDQAQNAGYQGYLGDTAAMQDFLNNRIASSLPKYNAPAQTVINPGATQVLDSSGVPIPGKRKFFMETTPTLTDLAVKNGVTNTGTQQISNTTPADKTTASLVSQPSVTQQASKPAWLTQGFDSEDDYNTYYYAKGGSVHHLAKKYAVGGGVDIADSAMPNPEQGIPQPVETPVAIPMAPAQAPPQSNSMAQMQEMLKAYATPSNDYAQELEDARRKSNAETEAFMSMIQKSRKPENDNLSQAELYFRLAAAAGAPTKTGGIAESLSNINREMSDYSKEQVGRRNSDLELQMKAQQLKAANAKEDLNVLRGLAGESMKDKRALISEMIKAEIPKAQSEAGKLALDMGLKVGTPEYQNFVTANGMQLLQAKINQMVMGPAIASQNAATSGAQLGVAQGNLDVAQERMNIERLKYLDKQNENKKLTPKELDIKWGKEDTLNNLKNAQKMIEQAYDLNDVAYTGNVFDVAKQKYGEVFSPEDPTVVNTGKLVNLLSAESLSRMKDVFGSNPTEGERAAQAQLSGALAKSKEVRKDIMLNYMEQLQKRMALEEKRLKQLDEGTSRNLPSKEESQ